MSGQTVGDLVGRTLGVRDGDLVGRTLGVCDGLVVGQDTWGS